MDRLHADATAGRNPAGELVLQRRLGAEPGPSRASRTRRTGRDGGSSEAEQRARQQRMFC
eukprot:2609137-Heterocapsa_arctica.AAC.1